MTDLRSRFRSLDEVHAPELWPEVMQRVELSPPDAGWSFPALNRFAPLALAATILVAILVGLGLLLGPRNIGPPEPSNPPPSSEASVSQAPASLGPAFGIGTWVAVEPMIAPRYRHTATLLSDGTVLVAGGDSVGVPTAMAEIYDPDSGSWTATGSLVTARSGHSATLLPDGRVLVVGGGGFGAPASAELYDPVTRSWTATSPTNQTHGRGHRAVLLSNGLVLVAGGDGDAPQEGAELFDPATETWTETGSMLLGRGYFTATLLPDGRVLAAGSRISDSSAEVYDPRGGSWTETDSMDEGRHDFTATLLADGTVLVAGGESVNTSEIFDFASETWSGSLPMLTTFVGGNTATLLGDGTVLIVGGAANDGTFTQLYDPRTQTWTEAPPTSVGHESGTATLLLDGSVLVVGGRSPAVAERYVPGIAD